MKWVQPAVLFPFSVTLDPEQHKFELRGFTHTQMLFNNNYHGATRLWLVESVAAEEPRILGADSD